MMKDFDKVFASHWLIDPSYIKPLMDRARAATEADVQAAIAAYRDPQPQIVGDIAVINCSGPITHRCSAFSMWYGSATVEGMQQQFRMALQDPAIKTIVFRVDSPGGCVDMVPEFADEIFQARDVKPIVAVSDTMIASAATWLFTGAGSVVVPRSGSIGSIGVYCCHFDYSKMLEDFGIRVTFIYAGEHKIDGNPYTELSADAKAQFQAEVDDIFKDFNATVARNRGVTTKQVLETFGQGLMFRGQKAVKLGLADKVSAFDAVIGRLQGSKRRTTVTAAVTQPKQVSDESFGCTCGINCQCQNGKTRWCDDNCERCEDGCACREHAKAQAAVAEKKSDEGVEPDENGDCQDGYEKRDDGMCYPIDEAGAGAEAKAAAPDGDDEEALLAALSR